MKNLSVPFLFIMMGFAISALVIPASGQAVISYPSGFGSSCDSTNIWLENNATCASPSIHVVTSLVHNASNMWFKTPENEQAFTTTFTFHVDCSHQPTDCGDGIGFMMICACSSGNPVYDPPNGKPGYTYSGFSSGQFSWSQCISPFAGSACYGNGDLTNPLEGILVKFDLYNNVTGSPGANETGFYSGGEYPQTPYNAQYDMSGSSIDMQSGHEFSVTLSYDGTTLSESITDTVTSATYTNSYTTDIPSLLSGNTAFIGFGGGTGAALVDIYVDTWTYTVAPAISYSLRSRHQPFHPLLGPMPPRSR